MKPIICLICGLASLGGAAVAAPPAKPNILVILADDLGFSDLGCYGSEIRTPNLDSLATHGLRFTQFYNTARCWPTRGALLTGYYPQQMNMDPPKGDISGWTRFLPQLLEPLGYHSYHSGKWHIRGANNAVAAAGFNRSYHLEDTNRYFHPKKRLQDGQPLPPVPENSGYYSTTALADSMIGFLNEHQDLHPDQPFFGYLAFTAPHFPLQAPPEDIARYRDNYLRGWDEVRAERWKKLQESGMLIGGLSEMEPQLKSIGLPPNTMDNLGAGEIAFAVPWLQLTEEQKRFQATKMAIHAAMIDRMDQEIGRVLDQIRAMGAWDNTVILFLSDNGASSEILVRGDGHDQSAEPGSAGSFLCLGPGWSSAANCPFRRHKVWVHEGGISTPLIVHWPKGIAAQGELRHDVGHVVDMVPTLLELAGGQPESRGSDRPPFPGISLVPALATDGAIIRKDVFFNHSGNRALRMGDYKIVSSKTDGDDWELYNVATDRAEQINLATAQPTRVRDMANRWQQLESDFARDAGSSVFLHPEQTGGKP